MAEQALQDVGGGESEPRELKDRIEDWVQAIDQWVQHIDQGMGGAANGAGTAVTPSPAPEADPDSAPRAG